MMPSYVIMIKFQQKLIKRNIQSLLTEDSFCLMLRLIAASINNFVRQPDEKWYVNDGQHARTLKMNLRLVFNYVLRGMQGYFIKY